MGMIMKTKLLLLTVVTLLAGCSLLSTPAGTVKKFMAAAEKGDAEAMTRLFSQKAVQQLGLDRIRANNEEFARVAEAAFIRGGKFRMEGLRETTTSTGKRFFFTYKTEKGDDSIRLLFDLSKEKGVWKIDAIGGIGAADETASPSLTPGLSEGIIEAPPPPSAPGSASNQTNSESNRPPISGGVLNGKATTLPKPPYPPVARAARAAGTVVVQVTVDEKGNVISARAVSGHPLLQAAAVAAARAAKFNPTKLSGQPVKVTGVITYQFTAE
jgi:TonB family protein